MKPVVIFSNFWDANSISRDGYLLHKFADNNIYFIWLKNYCVHSIALGTPDKAKIPAIKEISRLDFFCPTYDILKAVKSDGNWEKYVKEFKKLMVSRKNEIEGWVEGLQKDKIYILCCWENTNSGANCHRQILYNAFSKSSKFKDRAIWTYRHGNKVGIEDFKRLCKNKDQHLALYNSTFNSQNNQTNGFVLPTIPEFTYYPLPPITESNTSNVYTQISVIPVLEAVTTISGNEGFTVDESVVQTYENIESKDDPPDDGILPF